ncbi:hypothetical protein F5X68DRAFT_208578 [Plectosphaerella plurivora]|uniref:ATP-grasp domain-containing protein n=1 Tax=Plectosphaerella plurivora TaxID=936078 RepID=A0A9P8VAM7_9PEZI|nr:hypothetical protein F5X68DRAFT_208578 [Plectosphaerella plurivora]
MGSVSTSPDALLLKSGNLSGTLQALPQLSSSTSHQFSKHLWAQDFVLHRGTLEDDRQIIDLETKPANPVWDLLAQGLTQSSTQGDGRALIVRLFLSLQEGYIARCDFLERRFEGCQQVVAAAGFLKPLAAVSKVSHPQTNPFDTMLLAVGGILAVTETSQKVPELRLFLDEETNRRLAASWVLSQPVARRRVFWVQGREDFESIGRAYQAAWALGISLVIADQPRHWLESDTGPYAHLREAFVPFDITVDEGLAQRIIDAVRAYPLPIDGVVSISDGRLPAVARASEVLGLATSPPGAYDLAGDKGATRRLEEEGRPSESFTISSLDELEEVVASRGSHIRYPLIVKPCTGWNSDCVAKVDNLDQLRDAVSRASARHASAPKSSKGVVVEPYIDGPEVDANFVLLDGEILFHEITDDFPSSGDGATAAEGGAGANFMETLMFVPSALPQDERIVLRDSLRKSILRQGFSTGVFHCEARVRNSRAHYAPRKDNGLIDLQTQEADDVAGKGGTTASCYLHEVNARPPGYLNSVGTLLAYGVDFYAIRLLMSLGPDDERERIRLLSRPFLGDAPQYSLGVTILPATREGTMETGDAIEELLEKHAERLKGCVVDHRTCKKGGSTVQGPDSSELWYIGWVSVASRESRADCLEKVRFVRDNFSYKLVGE